VKELEEEIKKLKGMLECPEIVLQQLIDEREKSRRLEDTIQLLNGANGPEILNFAKELGDVRSKLKELDQVSFK
jgi:hypothetical protein